MLEGICTKCGYHCVGWALHFARHQACPKCGVGLEIYQDGHRVGIGYSPFTAETYQINLPSNVPTSHGKEEDSHEHK